MGRVFTLSGDLEQYSPTAKSNIGPNIASALQNLVEVGLAGRQIKKAGLTNKKNRELLNSILAGTTPKPFETPKAEGILGKIMEFATGGPIQTGDLPISPLELAAAKGKISAGAKDKPKRFDLLKQAENRAKTKMGVTDVLGLEPEQRIEFDNLIDTEFDKLQKQFGLTVKAVKDIPGATVIKKPEDVTLPATITTTSQAIKHLTTKAGMTRDQAVQWLKQRR